MSVRKAHNSGRNHLRNVVDYYQRVYISFILIDLSLKVKLSLTLWLTIEIGHEKAQSVIDSITSSYAAEGQANANPMLQAATMGAPGSLGPPPPPFGFPGISLWMQVMVCDDLDTYISSRCHATATTLRYAAWSRWW